MANLLNNLWKPNPDAVPLTPAEKLVHRGYDMLVSRSQVISPLYAEIIGVPCSTPGSESVAQHGAINCTINAAKLAEVYAIGGRPFFRAVRQSVPLYKDLCEYLLAFKEGYEKDVIRMDTNPEMMNNVLKLENLAEWVFGIAQPYFPKEDLVSVNSLAGRIGRGRFTRNTFAKKTTIEPSEVFTGIIVTTGLPDDSPIHGRITDTVMEQHFTNSRKKVSGTTGGWS